MNRWQQSKRKVGVKTLVPIIWDKFKIFLHKSLEETQVFVDTILHKLRIISQNQLKDIIDLAAYLEHLQTVLKELNTMTVLSNKLFI